MLREQAGRQPTISDVADLDDNRIIIFSRLAGLQDAQCSWIYQIVAYYSFRIRLIPK